jgi:hypothetical protein
VTYVEAWARAFALTAAVEVAVAAPLLRASEPSRWRLAGLVFFAQLASHPAVWFVFPELSDDYGRQVAMAEAWAVLSEAVFYVLALRASWRRALGVSLVANAASVAVGLLLRRLTGWV